MRILVITSVLSGVISSQAAVISISASGSYAQDFNTLATSGTANTWTNDSTIPAWFADRVVAGGITAYRAEAGASNIGALYSFGTGTNAERALGSASSGTPGNIAYGVVLKNDAATPVTIDSVSYTGEQWRNGGNTTAQNLEFTYSVSTALVALDPGTQTGGTANWTAVSALNFTTPTTGATAVALDGNAGANRTALSATPAITLQPGEFITLRWRDINDAGNDHGVAIDDFSVSFTVQPVPEPGVSLLGLAAAGLFLRRRR